MDKWSSKFKQLSSKLKEQKKLSYVIASIVVFSIIAIYYYQTSFSYQVNLNGKDLGIVKTSVMAETALAEAEEKVNEVYGESAKYESEMELSKVRVDKKDIIEQEQLRDSIFQNFEVYKPAAIIKVDGQEKLILETKEQAENILQYIKKPYEEELQAKENAKLLDISFAQEVEIVIKDVLVDGILSQQEARDKLNINGTQVETYKIAKGDNAWNISRSKDISIDSLEKSNPDKDIEKLMPGDTINLEIESGEKSLIDVIAKTEQTTEEEIDFETKKEKDSSLYVGKTKVKQKGKKGLKKLVKEIQYNNGTLEKEKTLSEEVLKEPTDKIVLVGTKPRAIATRGSAGQSSGNSISSRRSAPTYNGNIGSSIVRTAKHYIGTPYRRGGSSPSGFDCSGFVQYVYGQYGISVPRTSGGQGSVGGYVSRSNLKPGDIVVFSGHTGIYVGGNSFIHSPSVGKSVQITSLSNSYWSSKFKGGRRAY